MDPAKEIVEEVDEVEAPEEEEIEVSDEELVGAIDEELADEKTAVSETADSDDGSETSEPTADEGKPEERADEKQPPDGDAAAKAGDEPDDKKAAEDKPEEAKEAKPSDEFGTLEDNVPEKTRERFEGLKSKYDEIVAERDNVRAEADKWVEAITGTGTNPEQFSMALTWLSKINSDKPSDLQDAYEIMSRELAAIGKALGKPVTGQYDPLAEYPDIKEKVDDGLLDMETAQELIEARAQKKFSQASNQKQQAASDKQTSIQAAMEDVKKLGAELSASDPNFRQKAEYLSPIIEAAVASGADPSRWTHMIRHAYQKIPNPTPAQPKSDAPNPIRPTGNSPKTTPLQAEPGSELEALNQALERGY